MSSGELERCRNLLHVPGISVVKEAHLALEAGGVHAMHDPTEGGIATGLWEMAKAADVGLLVQEERLPILPECQTLCRHFALDPLGLIGSGSLLIAADQQSAAAIVERIRRESIAAEIVGCVVPQSDGCTLRGRDGRLRSLPVFARDEITRLFV
jgi:hydrogenase maturation factor